MNPADPFPLMSLAEAERFAAKEHARQVDEWLGFRIEETEQAVRAARFADELAPFETWCHLSPQVFLTSYWELRFWMETLKPAPGTTVADLGAGYARLAWVIEKHCPGVKFVGIECVPARVKEAKRLLELHGLKNSELDVGDLSKLPTAELYFLYDCGTQATVRDVVQRLSAQSPAGTRLLARGLRAREEARASGAWRAESEPRSAEAELFLRF